MTDDDFAKLLREMGDALADTYRTEYPALSSALLIPPDRLPKPDAVLSNARVCAECEYELTQDSPRWDGLRTTRFPVRLRLDAESSAIMESARRTAEEVAKWPSWKLGRCNCPTEWSRSG